MEINPLQRYNKYFDYASKIVKLCIESALFLHLLCVWRQNNNALSFGSALCYNSQRRSFTLRPLQRLGLQRGGR